MILYEKYFYKIYEDCSVVPSTLTAVDRWEIRCSESSSLYSTCTPLSRLSHYSRFVLQRETFTNSVFSPDGVMTYCKTTRTKIFEILYETPTGLGPYLKEISVKTLYSLTISSFFVSIRCEVHRVQRCRWDPFLVFKGDTTMTVRMM